MTRHRAVLALGVLLAACGRPQPVARPDVLLVTIDTLRADHCSAYGYTRRTTPRLDALAAEGVLFETAYAAMPTTAPSHATMFTALLPRSHGVLKNGQPLGPAPRTLAEVLKAGGYRTAAFVSAAPVDRQAGLGRGFDEYDDAADRTGDVTRQRAEAWLGRHGYLRPRADAGDQPPFFLWLHLYDPHSPYRPPAAYARLFPSDDTAPDLRRAIDAYDGEVRFADAQVGALLHHLDQAGRASRTLVVVTADHGEGLMDHGIMGHGLSLYEETLRVPLVVRWSGRLPGGRRIAEPVQLVDLAPTISELAGLSWTGAGPQGRSLASVLDGRARADPRREAFFQRRHYDAAVVDGVPVRGDKHAVRAGRWKYIEAPEEGTVELYDLVVDPSERHNLRERRSAEVQGMAGLIRVWHRATAQAPSLPVDEERARALRALGYVQ